MKKAKIMLAAITVMAVVSGVLALKAKTSDPGTLYTCGTQDMCVLDTDFGSYDLIITGTGMGIPITSATITSVNPQDTPCDVACSTTIDVTINE